MITRNGSPGRIHMINYFTKYRQEIFQYAIFQSEAKPSSIKELKISHLHSFLGMRGYIKGIRAMSAEARTAASEKGYEYGIGFMSAEARTAVGEKGYDNGIGAMLAKARTAASEKGYENGIAKGLESKAEAKSESWEVQYAEFENYDGMPESTRAS